MNSKKNYVSTISCKYFEIINLIIDINVGSYILHEIHLTYL